MNSSNPLFVSNAGFDDFSAYSGEAFSSLSSEAEVHEVLDADFGRLEGTNSEHRGPSDDRFQVLERRDLAACQNQGGLHEVLFQHLLLR